MILHRCFAWDRRARATGPGGALWIPRELQGDGRHDAPEHYGCLYASAEPVSAVVEEVARFAGTRLAAADLRRGGLPLALAALSLDEAATLVDLDEPFVLAAERLRPSAVATHDRRATQRIVTALHERHQRAAGVRWWSAFDPDWTNVTLFDRALPALSVEAVRPLRLSDDVVGEAAGFLGLPLAA